MRTTRRQCFSTAALGGLGAAFASIQFLPDIDHLLMDNLAVGFREPVSTLPETKDKTLEQIKTELFAWKP